jgi:hypothetical protein
MRNFYNVTTNAGDTKCVEGMGIEDAVESSGLSMDDIKHYDDATKRDAEEE